MPFRSRAQQRYLESKASPLSEAQKREWESATDFKKLPEKVKAPKRSTYNDATDSYPGRPNGPAGGKPHWSGK